MSSRSRRDFLADVGRGMLVASVGSATAFDLGLARALADDADARLTFGELDPLVTLMQETPPERFMQAAVGQLKAGVDLRRLVTAGALANARAFGGQDYTGYHTFMALLPAYQMSGELAAERQALPVLKVLYRNSSRLHEQNAHDHDVLAPVAQREPIDSARAGDELRDTIRAVEWESAEARFATLTDRSPDEAFNSLLVSVDDEPDVHRVVLAWRAWAMLGLAGMDYAHTFLRQSLRYCLDTEQRRRDRKYPTSEVREVLPRLLDEYKLVGKRLGNRQPNDAEVEALAQTIYGSDRAQAAEAAASALSEGMDPETVGEAISLAANLLVLHDPGRTERNSSPQKPPGCVHGDSVGVHASDSANAWRNIARASDARNQVAALVVGAYHTAGQTAMVTPEPYPYAHLLEEIRADDTATLLAQTREAILAQDQARACALADRYGQLDHAPRPLMDLLLEYAVSEDGALHAEKYYRTVSEEFTTTRPAFRWRQMIALARVTASENGFPAPGHREACELLGVS